MKKNPRDTQHQEFKTQFFFRLRAGFGLGPEPESPKISPKMADPKKPEARKEARRAFEFDCKIL